MRAANCLNLKRKSDPFSYWDVLRLMDLSWQRGGLLRGERVLTSPVDYTSFRLQRLSDAIGAVATNLSTGRELWLTGKGYPPCRSRFPAVCRALWLLSRIMVIGLLMA